MARPETTGEGEAREQARLRKRYAVIALLLGAGFLIGVYVGKTEKDAFINGGGALWPALALALSVIYFIAIVGGSALLKGGIDEHERHSSYKAISAAGGAYVVVYPIWFLLWRGGWAVEPIHWLLFIGFWIILAISNLYYRFR